jgi:hypothetical protein
VTEQPDQLTIDEELQTFDEWVRGLPVSRMRNTLRAGDEGDDDEEPEP